MQHDDGCPCIADVETPGDVDASSEVSTEVAEIMAEAAVEVAEIEAEVEMHQIDASLEHHQIEAEMHEDDNDTSVEHHEMEVEAQDELAEEVEVLTEVVEELEEALDGPEEEGLSDTPLSSDEESEGGEGDDLPVSVAPPARIEDPKDKAKKKPQRVSAFSKRHMRKG